MSLVPSNRISGQNRKEHPRLLKIIAIREGANETYSHIALHSVQSHQLYAKNFKTSISYNPIIHKR